MPNHVKPFSLGFSSFEKRLLKIQTCKSGPRLSLHVAKVKFTRFLPFFLQNLPTFKQVSHVVLHFYNVRLRIWKPTCFIRHAKFKSRLDISMQDPLWLFFRFCFSVRPVACVPLPQGWIREVGAQGGPAIRMFDSFRVEADFSSFLGRPFTARIGAAQAPSLSWCCVSAGWHLGAVQAPSLAAAHLVNCEIIAKKCRQLLRICQGRCKMLPPGRPSVTGAWQNEICASPKHTTHF